MSAKRLRNALVTGSALFCLFGAGQLWAFSLDDVAARLKPSAEQKYQAPRSNLPNEFRDMKFADYQKIRFRNEKAQWAERENPVQAVLLSPGHAFRHAGENQRSHRHHG
jgi:periplasmic glucans biosynthesis protein